MAPRAAPDRLVILGSGITALAVARRAHRLGMEPVIFDIQAQTAALSRLARIEIPREARRARMLERLEQLGRERRSFLVSTADAWLQFLIMHRSQLDAAYHHVLHPSNDALSICLDKERFARWCEQCALPSPRHYRIDDPSRLDDCELDFPLLLRPAETLHSASEPALKAVEVHSREQLRQHLQALDGVNRRPVLSESLLGRQLTQFSVGFARHRGQMLTVVARKLRPLPAACAPGSLVATTTNAGVESLARRVAVLLDYEGIGEVEILQDAASGENFLIEVNPRPWLQFALAAATGRDLLGLAVADEPAAANAQVPAGHARWLDFRADLRACFAAPDGLVRRGRLGPWTYLRSILAAREFARWSRSDQGPFWRDLLDLLRLARYRPAAPGRGTPRAGGSGRPHHLRSLRQPGADWRSSSGSE